MAQKLMTRLLSPLFVSFILLIQIISSVHAVFENEIQEEDRTTRANSEEYYDYTIYFQSDLIYRAAAGDLIPEREGVEFATCSTDGTLSVHWGYGVSWKTETAYRSYIGGNKGETARIFSLDVGEILPEVPGDEIVTVDEDYSVTLLSRSDEVWSSNRLIRDIDWLYEVDIGNLDKDRQNEIVYVGDTREVSILDLQGNEWIKQTVYEDPFYLDCCYIANIDETTENNEIITGGGSGTVVMLTEGQGGWDSVVISDFDSPILDIISLDFDPRYPGKEIFASTFDGRIMSLHRTGGKWEAEVVHNEENLQYCLEFGLLDENEKSLVVATWNQRVGTIIFDEGFVFKEVYRGDQQMYGCLVADIDLSREGNEIIATDRLGRVQMLYKEDPGVYMDLPFLETSSYPGESIEIPFFIRYQGGFQGIVTLTAEGVDAVFDTDILESDSMVMVNMTTPLSPGNSILSITASWSLGSLTEDIEILVSEEMTPVRIGPNKLLTSVAADRQVKETFWGYSEESLENPLLLYLFGIPNGLEVNLNRDSCDPCLKKDYFQAIFSVKTWMTPGIYHLFVIAEDDERTKRAIPNMPKSLGDKSLAKIIVLISLKSLSMILIKKTQKVPLAAFPVRVLPGFFNFLPIFLNFLKKFIFKKV